MLRIVTTLVISACLSVSATEIAVAGSSTIQPIMQQVAKEWTGATVQVGGGGSSDGITKLTAGAIAVAMASRQLKDAELAEGLVGTVIGIDGICIAVHKDNPVAGLTTENVHQIFTGAITDWSAVGGKAGAIVLLSTNEKHATNEAAAEHFQLQLKGDDTTQTVGFTAKGGNSTGGTAQRVNSNKDVAARITTMPNAIAFLSIGVVEQFAGKGVPLKALALDGASPASDSVKAGTWVIKRPLLLVTKGAPTGAAKDLIDHVLSPAGQALVAAAGFTPAR
jgi:phosphate transport system substrate-binding protein